MATEDETKMLSHAARYAQTDPLLDNERVKVLVFQIRDGQHLAWGFSFMCSLSYVMYMFILPRAFVKASIESHADG